MRELAELRAVGQGQIVAIRRKQNGRSVAPSDTEGVCMQFFVEKARPTWYPDSDPGGSNMTAKAINTRPLTKADYDTIVRVIDKWWGGPTSALAHPVYFYELGKHAMVAEHHDRLVGFLLGFIVEPKNHRTATRVGYVHLVGIHPDYRRRQVGTRLYEGFTETCRKEGCTRMKAITTLGNEGSVRFHEALGWQVEERGDYAGPGRVRLVFTRPIGPAD
ncbi:MAG: GNAT family N-acetyltransferase [Myxococcota bacterium]